MQSWCCGGEPGPIHPAGATPGDEGTISAVNLSSFSDCGKKKRKKENYKIKRKVYIVTVFSPSSTHITC